MSDSPKTLSPERYLPAALWERWQTGDMALALEHLHAVLRTVLAYLPRHVIGARWADPGAPPVSGSFAQATLMFADISGFTAMSERLSELGREGAEIITGIVNDYFDTMLDIIARHDGDLFKFGGDALLVGFEGERAAARACAASLEMQTAMARFAVIPLEQGTFNLRMKIGLGSGTVFLTSLGSDDRLEFTVMGPPLGQMAAAESQAEAGEILLDRATYQAAKESVDAAGHTAGFYRLAGMGSETRLFGETEFPEDALDAANVRLSSRQSLIQRLDALTPYLPPRILEQIIAAPGQQMIEGEHRLVTVLFANFYGVDDIITALGADHVDQITAILNHHFRAMQAIIRKFGGTVNKVDTYAVGYRIMALFGAPVAHEDDPARAVRAALEMQAAISNFGVWLADFGRDIWGPNGQSEIENLESKIGQRIGINTGYVFAGNLGSALRREYSVMGDEVNLAARLMGAAEEGQVLISQSTAQHTVGLFESRARDPIFVKGKQQAVPNYQVLRGVAGREEAPTVRSAFFGRKEELAWAQALVDELSTKGRGAVLDLSGSRGMGKSRLVEELCAYAARHGVETLSGTALSYGRGSPYLPWLGILNTLLGFVTGLTNDHESLDSRRERLLAALKAVGLDDWAPIVGGVLGIEIAETPLTASLDAQLRQQRFFDVVLHLLQGSARRAPLVLVLDDVQWADDVSLDLAAYIARNLTDVPLLFVISHWPDMKNTPWRDEENVRFSSLTELDAQASLDLARWILGQGDLSPALSELVLSRAQGNPLFIEEVTRTLRDSGSVELDKETLVWDLSTSAALSQVPTTLTGLIMSRLDGLETTDRRLLQVAAVAGVDFRASALSRIYPFGDLGGTLRRRLDQLAQQDLIAFAPPERYTFRQTLTQEVAYSSLSFARRRELHARVGYDIEQHTAGDLAEQHSILARHFDEGRVFDKAFAYLVKAGDKARDEYANETALEDYRRALEIAAEVKEKIERQALDVLEAMGDVYLLTSRYAEAVEHFEQAIAHSHCTARRCSDLLRKIAQAYEQQGNYDEALAYLERGRWVLSWDQEDKSSIEMARICDLSGWVRMRRGEMDAAVQQCEQGLAILSQLERDPNILRAKADVHNTLGTIRAGQGNYAQAAQAYQRSTELRQQVSDYPGLARSYNNLALTRWTQGDLSGAQEFLEHSLDISRQIGNNNAMAFVHNNLGVVAFTIGQVDQALEAYRAALALRRRIGDDYGVAQTNYNIGETHLSLAQYDQAQAHLEQAARIFERIQSEGELPEVYGLLAEVQLAQDDAGPALAYATRARRIAETIGSVELQGIAERVLARCQAAADNSVLATQCFEASIQLLEESGHQIELARSHYEFGTLLADQVGQDDLARQHLRQAVDLFTTAGAEKEADQARQRLAKV